ETRHAGIQDAKAILAAFDFEVGFVSQVHGHNVAEEPVKVEDVEIELAARIEGFVSQHQVDVVIQVTPALGCTRGQTEVYALAAWTRIVWNFAATVDAAVNVKHGSVALVHVL